MMATDTGFAARLGPWVAVIAWLFAILLVLMIAVGASLDQAVSGFFNGAFGGRNSAYLMTTIGRSALIIGMALAVLISFRAGLYNIGGEGQLVVGGIVAALVGIYLPGPGPMVLAVGILAAMAAASLWAVLAGALQVYLGVPLLIGSLLLNYPARYISSYLVGHPFRDVAAGLPQTHMVPQGAWIPNFPGTRLDMGIILVLLAAVFTIVYAYRTVPGYRTRMNGLAPDFARASGLPVKRLVFQTLAMSGAIAGLVGAIAVFGVHYRFSDGMLVQPLYAWTGIIAVLMVGMVPWAVPLSGFFFAAVQTGAAGMERTAGIPKEIGLIMQAAIILFVASRLAVVNLAGSARGEGNDDRA
ncbi:ABC transporter permease [Pelagibacterium montanilacus]|uniref:ABC transporter permease n=1 Tax=Pelagibacterium montanilacus TaxID=2185280 RepID=UPI000F8E2BAA|nr:ABC transporter permease [Pelagibacterium montanilacus]